ncbi:MAG: GTP 3',8-cyclase MoaA [Bacillota bacterium]
MKDKQGRNINYIRVSVTDRCNLRCRYCMPEEGIVKKEHSEMLALEEIYKVIEACMPLGINKVRLTGGEPLVRKGIVELISKLSKLEQIKDIALTTNGVLLAEYADDLKKAGLSRVNISLDTLDGNKYRSITRCGKIQDVLNGIEAAKACNLTPIKINTVLIGGFNDDEIEDFVNLTKYGNIDVRFIELMPIGQASSWTKDKFIPNSIVLDRVKELEEVEGYDPGSTARYYKLPDALGKVGLINPISHKFCSECNRIRLTADGKLKPCLHSNQEIDIKSILREDGGNLFSAIEAAVYSKPLQHNLEDKEYIPINRDMFRIGG